MEKSKFWLLILLLVELGILWLYIPPVLHYGPLGFPLDDSWIYTVFARRFATNFQIAFNSGQPAVGFTSSLWFLLLSLGYLLHFPILPWSLFWGCLFHFITAVAISFLLKEFLDSGSASKILVNFLSWLGGLLVLICGSLIWYSLSGMETSMFLALGLLSIWSLSRRRYWLAGGALALLLVTRMEGMVLWGLGLIYAVVGEIGHSKVSFRKNVVQPFPGRDPAEGESHRDRGRAASRAPFGSAPFDRVYTERSRSAQGLRQGLRKALHYISFKNGLLKRLLPLCFLPVIFLAFELGKNFFLAGGILPTTFAGRKWLSVPVGGRGPIDYLRLWLYGLKISLLPSFLQNSPFLVLFCIVAVILALISLLIVCSQTFNKRKRPSGLFLLLGWCFFHNLLYIILLPSPSQAGRYQAVNFVMFWLLLYLPLAAALLELNSANRMVAAPFKVRRLKRLFDDRHFNRLIKMLCNVTLVIIIAAVMLLDLNSTGKWKTIYLSTVRHINDVHIESARWINEFLPPGSRISAFDIGALKYFSPETEVIDLGGLVDKDFAVYLKQDRVVDYIRNRGAEYLAMVEWYDIPGRIFDNLKIRDDPQLELKPLIAFILRPEIYRLHYQEAANTFPKIVIYKISWSEDLGE